MQAQSEKHRMPSRIVHIYTTGNTKSSLAMTIPKIFRDSLGLTNKTPVQVTQTSKDTIEIKKLDLEHMTAAEFIELQRSSSKSRVEGGKPESSKRG